MTDLPSDIRQSIDAIAAAIECKGHLPEGHLRFIEETLERCLREVDPPRVPGQFEQVARRA